MCYYILWYVNHTDMGTIKEVFLTIGRNCDYDKD